MIKKEDNSIKQDAKAGDSSSITQAGRDVIHNHGLSLTDAKSLFEMLFKDNFLALRDEAKEIATQRASELVNDYLSQLNAKSPDSIKNANSPDIQYVVYEAQKSHARRGDQDLSKLLTDLLVNRTIEDENELVSVVYNEALLTVPKLTKQQVDLLSICFVFKYTKHLKISRPSDLFDFLNKVFDVFLTSFTKQRSNFQHIEYAGCGNVTVMSTDLLTTFKNNYAAIFSKGFSLDNYKEIGMTDTGLLINCFNNSNLFQFVTMDDVQLVPMLDALNTPKDVQDRAVNLFKTTLMDNNEIFKVVVDNCPSFEQFVDLWKNTNMVNLTLTSVGIAIAQANLRAKASMEYNLHTWLK